MAPATLYTGKLPKTEDPRDILAEQVFEVPLHVSAVAEGEDFSDTSVTAPYPDDFGHEKIEGHEWQMLGNGPDDTVQPGFMGAGNCVWAGADEETIILGTEGGHHPIFTGADAIEMYSEATGYVIGDERTDRGTEVRAALKFRKAKGIIDASNKRHHIGAYLALEAGNLTQLYTYAFHFGVVGIGIRFPNTAMNQFDNNEPWDVVSGASDEGGHYIPVVARRDGNPWVISWGRCFEMTEAFYERYCDEAWVYLSASALDADGKTPDGFNKAALQELLAAL